MDRRQFLHVMSWSVGAAATLPLAVPAALAESTAGSACCGPISAQGERLRTVLDNCGVDQRWLPGFKVRWQTGESIAAWPAGSGAHTHCSAFVASMAMQLGIYLLRPPEHGQTLLANAQVAWLLSQPEAPRNWRNLGADVTQVQAHANQGLLVLAAVENPNPAKPGHIAIVRPGFMETSELTQTGPMLTQAGTRNAFSIPLSQGFRGHRGAWVPGGGGSVRFFAHEVDWARLG